MPVFESTAPSIPAAASAYASPLRGDDPGQSAFQVSRAPVHAIQGEGHATMPTVVTGRVAVSATEPAGDLRLDDLAKEPNTVVVEVDQAAVNQFAVASPHIADNALVALDSPHRGHDAPMTKLTGYQIAERVKEQGTLSETSGWKKYFGKSKVIGEFISPVAWSFRVNDDKFSGKVEISVNTTAAEKGDSPATYSQRLLGEVKGRIRGEKVVIENIEISGYHT